MPALTSPWLQLLATDHDDKVLAYLRTCSGGNPEALIALNFDRAPVRVRLRTPALADFSQAAAQDLATGRRWHVDLRYQALTLPAYGGAIVLSGLRSRAAGAH